MKKLYLLLLLAPTNFLSAETEAVSASQESKPTPPAVAVAQTPSQSAQAKPKPAAQKQTVQSFYRFVQTFLMILTNQQVQSSLKGIEKMLATLMQTAYQIMQTNKPKVTGQKKSILDIDPELIEELAHGFKAQIKKTNPPKTHTDYMRQDKQNEKEIILNFSNVVQNFFEILRDPENPEKVPAHILGMLAGMVNIGTIAMTKHHVSMNADYNQLQEYAESLDPEIKAEMYRIMITTSGQSTTC